MNSSLNALIIAAAFIGFTHTILGPDHYLPFIMMSWARKWSAAKTGLITLLCGLGHIGGSVVLAVTKLEPVESARGNLAAWLLIAFGLVYFVWGLRRAYRNQPHVHNHTHAAEVTHTHLHSHHTEHTHIHDTKPGNIAPWTLFVIFVFGPCYVSGCEEQPFRPVGGDVCIRDSHYCHYVRHSSAYQGRSEFYSAGTIAAFRSRHSRGYYMPLWLGHCVPWAVST
jgi:hypothetical protein